MICTNSKELKRHVDIALINANMTKRTLADKLNITPQSLNSRLNSNISINRLLEITDAIGYDLEINFVPRKQDN